jgi:hypothetical protein
VLASAIVAVYASGVLLVRIPQFIRAGAIRTRSTQLILAVAISATVLFGLNTLVFGSLIPYALALCLQLSVAAISLYTLVVGSTSYPMICPP